MKYVWQSNYVLGNWRRNMKGFPSLQRAMHMRQNLQDQVSLAKPDFFPSYFLFAFIS